MAIPPTPRTGRPATDVGRLLASCPDRRGIVSALSTALAETGANIIRSDQHSTNPEGGDFFLRMEFHLDALAERRRVLEQRLEHVGRELDLDWRLTSADTRKRVAIFASRYDHCLLDLLWRWRTGELDMDLVGVVSNHLDRADDVAFFDVPYHHVAVTHETKQHAEL